MSPSRIDQDELDDALAGRLGAALAPIAPPTGRREALRARALSAVRPSPLTVRAGEPGWEPLLAGIERKTLSRDGAGHAFLLRFAPGAVLPSHPHRADEECVVVSGEVTMGELTLGPGDYRLERAGSTHVEVRSAAGAVVFIRYGAG